MQRRPQPGFVHSTSFADVIWMLGWCVVLLAGLVSLAPYRSVIYPANTEPAFGIAVILNPACRWYAARKARNPGG